MKICVAGLGIIGGSLCLSLKRAGYAVDGYDRSAYPREYALNNGYIDGTVTDFSSYDVAFVALPPKATVEFIENTPFKDGAVVADICGVKKPIEAAICRKYRNFSYVGCHPMAGREVSGIEAARAYLFDNASMVITVNETTNAAALDIIRNLTREMGFGRIVECSAEIHDRKIAYTSQLAHIVSNAYVKDGDIDCCVGFTGGSFQDMTRIAGVDESMWAALYLENAANISEKITALINSLAEIRDAIDGGKKDELEEILKKGRVLFENCKKISGNDDISVKKLK
ncbi:MAG: prephenate dehydrogenase/arogenate dehydrogenase family protein [Clostridia bacterium]|jgi:prephenate dehydrogenase|nr:prephenate dehydrogenase/arogenate dehydrogenase family protein [Clostridia bacterium]